MKIKVCGLTRAEDARAAARAGADYLGLIFSRSPRQITVAQARQIVEALPEEVVCVGVFVNEEVDLIRAVISQTGIKAIQLHGEESPGFCRSFELPVIKALHIKDGQIADRIALYETEAILLEPYVPGKYGGTGKVADWALAAKIVGAFPQKKFFLAGGLGPDNVAAAARTVHPFAVDVNSGVEESPGIKSREKIEQIVKVVRNYDATG